MNIKALIAEYEELRRAAKQLDDQSWCLGHLLTEIKCRPKDCNGSHDSSREAKPHPTLVAIYDFAVGVRKECAECFRDIYMWEVVEEEFAAYLAMPGAPQAESYSRYHAIFGQIQDGVDKWDERAVRVRMPVSRMVEELKRRNWPNDTQRRAKLIKELGVQAYKAYRDNPDRNDAKARHELAGMDAMTGEALTAEYERLQHLADDLGAKREIIERRLQELEWDLPRSYKYLGDTPVVEIGGQPPGAPA